MLDAFGRKIFSIGFKRVIISGVNSAIAHKVADAVVNRATSTSQKVGKSVVKGAASARQKAVDSVVNNAIDSPKKWFVGRKRSVKPSVTETMVLFSISSSSSSMDSILNFQEKYTESDAIKS